ncbi:unnamed protein product [Prorocentrum cordatum]|uniref:Uncharacterized protein n=1 Tax=Prorocentrum cordatum TaxID=2364126 RepID=A0ABN9SNF1_9DINO|nr:unnamed protein product [Polarella glacialis]
MGGGRGKALPRRLAHCGSLRRRRREGFPAPPPAGNGRCTARVRPRRLKKRGVGPGGAAHPGLRHVCAGAGQGRGRLDCAPVFAPPPRGRPHAPLLAAGAAAAASTASGPTQASGSSCARCSISSRCRHSSMRSSRGRSLRRGTRRRRSTQRSLHTGRRRDTVQDTHARALR